MKIRTMLGLAAAGGLLYYHRQRGGDWTADSFKHTARHLWKSLQNSGERAKNGALDAAEETARKAEKLAQSYKH